MGLCFVSVSLCWCSLSMTSIQCGANSECLGLSILRFAERTLLELKGAVQNEV